MEVEFNPNPPEAKEHIVKGTRVMITPPLNSSYWTARVHLYRDQYIVCFPKFTTIGCGFAIEEGSWNTNLPLGMPAERIYNHIRQNKKYDEIKDEDCLQAIRLLQEKVWKGPIKDVPPIELPPELL